VIVQQKLDGVDTQESGIMEELEKCKEFKKKIEQRKMREKGPEMNIDAAAAKRMIKHSLPKPQSS